jgi:hypothetical protein
MAGTPKRGEGTTGAPACSITSVYPLTGYSDGGESFTIAGEGFDPREWDDLFTAALLDVAKWTDISAGGGTVTTGANRLQLSTTVAVGATAGIESVNTWNDVQGEIVSILPNLSAVPPAEVELINFMLRVDANNYCTLRVTFDVDGVYTLECDVYRGGVQQDFYSTSWTYGAAIFKILRWGSTVYFIANGSIVYTSEHFYNNAAAFRIYAYNLADAYDAYSTVQWFYFRPFAIYEDRVVHDTKVVSDTRIRGGIPYSIDTRGVLGAFAGDIDLSVVGRGLDTDVNGYEYTYRDRLKIINSTAKDLDLQITDDDQLLTPSGVKRGYGI